MAKTEERFVKASELLLEKTFLEKLKKAENHADVQKLYAENGVELSEEDIELMVQESGDLHAETDEELNADQLENVAGGIGVGTAFAIAGVSLLFYTTYGYIKYGRKKR